MTPTDKKVEVKKTQLVPGCCIHKWERNDKMKKSVFRCKSCRAVCLREDGAIVSFYVVGAERY